MKSVIVIGNSKPPITGVTIIFDLIYKLLNANNIKIKHIRTNTSSRLENFDYQGDISIRKLLISVWILFYGTIILLFSPGVKHVYMVPGESYFGFVRFVPFMRICKMLNKKIFLHFHGQMFIDNCEKFSKKRLQLVSKELKKAEKIIVLGNTYLERFSKDFPFLLEKLVICPNGISNDYLLDEDEFENKISRAESECNILYLGNLIRSKGILDLLESVEILDKNSFNFKLFLCGDIEPEIKADILEFINRNPDRIIYMGIVGGELKKKILKDSRIFCLPTYMPSEAQPISILEAMASGCAIITTDQGGIKDIFKDKFNGFYCDKRNPFSIAEKIIAANAQYSYFAKNNHQTIKSIYSEQSFFERFSRILNS